MYVAVYQLALRHPVPVARQLADIAAMAPGKPTSASAWAAQDSGTRPRYAA